jgi:hypothetical protein
MTVVLVLAMLLLIPAVRRALAVAVPSAGVWLAGQVPTQVMETAALTGLVVLITVWVGIASSGSARRMT